MACNIVDHGYQPWKALVLTHSKTSATAEETTLQPDGLQSLSWQFRILFVYYSIPVFKITLINSD